MSQIAFTVPGKIARVNRLYCRTRSGGVFKSQEARDATARVQVAARMAMRGRNPLTGALSLGLALYYANPRQDIDSGLKTLLDAMQGIVFADDAAVRRVVLEKNIDKAAPRVEVTVSEVTP